MRMKKIFMLSLCCCSSAACPIFISAKGLGAVLGFSIGLWTVVDVVVLLFFLLLEEFMLLKTKTNFNETLY